MQLNEYIIEGSDACYVNFEVNLVMKGGGRKNLFYSPDQGLAQSLAKDVQCILSVPLWETI